MNAGDAPVSDVSCLPEAMEEVSVFFEHQRGPTKRAAERLERVPTWKVTALALLLTGPLSACDDAPTVQIPDDSGISAELVIQGLELPVHVTAPPSDPRVFVVEQEGRVLVFDPVAGEVLDEPFLDVSERVSCCGERGLLSVAFHPGYAANGRFFVAFTDNDGDLRVERFEVSADPDVADPDSDEVVIEIEQPFPNHNGGLVAFGPDGMLYVGVGDGGSAGDPLGHGQNRNTLLGSILRLDVDGNEPYEIPPDNPFVGIAGSRAEIWAYGLRNPWRFSFDRVGGHLYIADVGQNQWEEVNRAPATQGGLNYGWNVMEGAHCFGAGGCNQGGLTLPILEYSHSDGCSITGGHVYRGASIPDVVGEYFFSDYCDGWVRSARAAAAGAFQITEWDLGDLGNITSFGEDSAGELYIVTEEGSVYQIVES